MAFMEGILDVQALPWGTVISIGAPAVVFGGLLMWFMITCLKDHQRRRSSKLPPVPVVPGLPVIGNLLQLKEKKPHKTFAKWAEVYGPIYSIKTGANRMVVLNSNEVAKEAMITRYASISSRKLSNALTIITSGKNVVAMSDYNEYYKTSKRHVLLSLLGSNAQKRHRVHRDALLENLAKELHASLSMNPHEPVNFRKPFQYELFALGFRQGLGMNVDSIYVEQFGKTFTREDIFKVIVTDVMEGGIEIDWRDFFPYLKWIPNKSFEMKIEKIYKNREAVMKALIKEQKKRFDSGQELNCTLDHLLSEAKSFTENQILMLIWESIIETTDTTLVTTEWAMYEIAKDPEKQDHLYREIVNICGVEKVTEEDLSKLPYLSAIFHETLRKYSPVPIVPMRYVHEDTQIGGYYVPAGTEIAINIYGCHMDKKMWDSPEEWKPERFLDGKYDQTDLYKTMAFGGGKRVCAGALQAMTISCMAIARLVQEFEWGLSDGERDNVHTLGVTNQKLYPLLVMIVDLHIISCRNLRFQKWFPKHSRTRMVISCNVKKMRDSAFPVFYTFLSFPGKYFLNLLLCRMKRFVLSLNHPTETQNMY